MHVDHASAVKKKDHQKFVDGFVLSGLLGSGRASMLPLGTLSLGLWVIAVDPAFIAGHQSIKNCRIWIDQLNNLPAVMRTSFFLIFSKHLFGTSFAQFPHCNYIFQRISSNYLVPRILSNYIFPWISSNYIFFQGFKQLYFFQGFQAIIFFQVFQAITCFHEVQAIIYFSKNFQQLSGSKDFKQLSGSKDFMQLYFSRNFKQLYFFKGFQAIIFFPRICFKFLKNL